MTNEQYLASIGVTGEAALRCLEAMEKYQENHWWEPDVDPRKYAYYQMHESITLTNDFDHFHEAIELLLGRPVFTHEFAISAQSLMAEAERAWAYQVGCTSDRERTERVIEAVKGFADWCEQNGKPMSVAISE